MNKKLIVVLSFAVMEAVTFSQVALVYAANNLSHTDRLRPTSPHKKPKPPKKPKPTSPRRGHSSITDSEIGLYGVHRFLTLNK